MITAAAHDHRCGALIGRAEHVLRQRVIQDGRVEDLFFGNRLAPERIRVLLTVAEVLRRHLGQRRLADVVVVNVLVGLHAEELGGDELPVLAVPPGKSQTGWLIGERAACVLVHSDGDADVVLAEPDGVGGLLNRRRRCRAGVEDVGERDACQPDQPGDGVRVGDLVATPEPKLDGLPFDTRVLQRRLYRLGAHLHACLVEPSERMEAHPDDRDVVHS